MGYDAAVAAVDLEREGCGYAKPSNSRRALPIWSPR